MLARGPHLDAIRSGGLRLLEPDGSTVVGRVAASSDLTDLGPQDVVLLALKAHQIEAVAPSLHLLYDEGTTVVPLQNGVPWWFFQRLGGPFEGRHLQTLDPNGVIEACIPVERIVGAIAFPAAHRESPGVIRLIEGDKFPVGELDGSRSERAGAIADSLKAAGFSSRVLTDIRQHLWVKAWGNLAFNPISALTGATLAEICRHPETRRLATTMMEEASRIAEALGLRIRVSIEQRIEGAEGVGEHKTSMLQDLEAGKPLEIDCMTGAIVELAARLEVSVPHTEAVHACVKLLDRLPRRPAAVSS